MENFSLDRDQGFRFSSVYRDQSLPLSSVLMDKQKITKKFPTIVGVRGTFFYRSRPEFTFSSVLVTNFSEGEKKTGDIIEQ